MKTLVLGIIILASTTSFAAMKETSISCQLNETDYVVDGVVKIPAIQTVKIIWNSEIERVFVNTAALQPHPCSDLNMEALRLDREDATNLTLEKYISNGMIGVPTGVGREYIHYSGNLELQSKKETIESLNGSLAKTKENVLKGSNNNDRLFGESTGFQTIYDLAEKDSEPGEIWKIDRVNKYNFGILTKRTESKEKLVEVK